MSSIASTTADAPPSITNNPVLDMLNAVASVNDQPYDFWQNDVDVSDWLVCVGWFAEPVTGRYPLGVLLVAAQHLREAIRVLAEARKASRAASADAPNTFLRQTPSHSILVWKNSTSHVKRLRPTGPVEQCLASLTETAARLLAEGDFQLVRVHERPEYTL